MRLIGHLDTDRDARTFGDFLYVHGIENQAEREGDKWALWVHSDDQIATATRLLSEFRANPADPRFQAGSPAEQLRKQEEASQAEYRKRVVEGRKLFPGMGRYGFGFVTYGLIVACVIVFILSHMGNDKARIAKLFITNLMFEGDYVKWAPRLPEIRHGEVWRLVSPILIHFGPAHILFNMLWLRDLGSMFEGRINSWYFALFVVVTAAASNVAQYYFHGPIFGGVSGVVYALIGYAWMRGRFDPAAGIQLDRQSLILALIWFAACFTGYLGPIANAAHGVGLAMGMLWGFTDAKRS